MAKYDFEMILEYPKIFAHTADMGDPSAPPKSAAGSIAKKGGQTIVNAYFVNGSDLEKLLEDGMDPKPLGYDRVLEGNEEYGIGKFIRLKRDVKDNIKTFQNKKGEVEINFGGLPKVIDLRDPENKKLWDVEEDGEVGNGTKAIVRFDMYSEGAGFRLEAIAITDLVEYVKQETSEYADVWDV